MKIATFRKFGLFTTCESRYTSWPVVYLCRNRRREGGKDYFLLLSLPKNTNASECNTSFMDHLFNTVHVTEIATVVWGTFVICGRFATKTEGAIGAAERAALRLDTVVVLDRPHDYRFRLGDCRIADRWLYPLRFGQSKERW